MSEAKDQGIKLFGRTIPVPEKSPSLASCGSSVDDSTDPDRACSTNSSPEEDKNGDGEDRATEKPTSTVEDNGSAPVNSEESLNPEASSMVSENPKTPSVEKESSTPKTSKTEEEQNSDPSNSTTSQEKPLKKPDKIIPCPRCNSMDTKFCYYNNYNVNQPRHFCKNCQRYWTAGGTMRNVPVGAGRRKNKNSASSHYRHITVSETLQNGHTDVVPSSAHHPALRTNGTVLTFGSDAPLCESMASVLNIADKSMRNGIKNGFQEPEELRIQLTTNNHPNVSSAAAVSNSKDETEKAVAQEPVLPNCQNFPPQIQCFPGGPWPYTWNSPQLNPPLSPHGFYPPPSGFPMPFYPAPAAYWGTWNIPWIPQLSSPKTPSSGPNSPTLGKHSRDGSTITAQEEETQKETNPKKYLWVPKTLRIDDPGDAAKSSIWTTLGIKNDKADSGLFKAFQPKGDEKRHLEETSPVLQANPAALSRSRNFHENS